MVFVVLDAGISAAKAKRRVDAAGPVDVVLVRRLTLEGVQWHALEPDFVDARLEHAPQEARLASLVPLDRMNEVPATAEADIGDDGYPEGVIVDGNRVVAFSFPSPEGLEGPTRGSSVPITRGPVKPPLSRGRGAAEDAPPPTAPPGQESFGAHADIGAPDMVAPDDEFFVTLEFSAEPTRDTLGGGIWIESIDNTTSSLDIDVHLVGDFVVVEEAGAARTVTVDRDTLAHDPIAFRVSAGQPPPSFDPGEEIWIGRVMMMFSYKGAPCGQAWREIRVNTTGTRANARASDRVPVATGGTGLGQQAVPAPDLTIKLMRTPSAAGDGVFSLVLTSPHFDEPVAPESLELGDEPQAFSSQLIKQVNRHISDRVSDDMMHGIGLEIAEKLPAAFWPALQTVWNGVQSTASGAIPNVLLLTDDPYVPWELAWMEQPLDSSLPSFLGAQVNMGRWSVDEDRIPDGTALEVQGLGVVVGHYKSSEGIAPLPSAVAEGSALAATYNARTVDATDRSLDQVLRGRIEDQQPFEFEAIHFAGHGESDPEKNAAYVMLSDGTQLSEFVFRSPAIASNKQAFMFLNACQVGTAFGMLGEYAGVAGKAIRAGFRGFVAPLWSVDDAVAKAVSLGFYRAAADGETAAAYLRITRGNFRETDAENAHTTWLAYIFYGHPSMRLAGPPIKEWKPAD